MLLLLGLRGQNGSEPHSESSKFPALRTERLLPPCPFPAQIPAPAGAAHKGEDRASGDLLLKSLTQVLLLW